MRTDVEGLFGATIKRARERRNLTGEAVRRLTGIHPTSLSFMERNQQEPSGEQIRRLAEALGLNISRLAALAARTQFTGRAKGAA